MQMYFGFLRIFSVDDDSFLEWVVEKEQIAVSLTDRSGY